MKALKIIILFVIVLSGCSSKHILRTEREPLEREILESWDELKGKIFKRDSLGFSLSFQVKNFDVVKKRLRVKEFYEYGSGDPEEKSIQALSGLVLGCSGCVLGYKCGESMDEEYASMTKSLLFPTFSGKGCIAACIFALPGFVMMGDGMNKGREYTKVIPDFVKIDTVCVDSLFLVKQKVKFLAEKVDFEKAYYTDEDGNIELSFDEIIPEPTEADSILNIIIQYEEMVDTLDVRLR